MFKIKSFKRNRIGQKNLTGVEKKRKINLMKSCILTIGLLATLNLVGCGKEDNSSSSIGDQSPSVSKSETDSKARLAKLCNSSNSLTASYETKQYWISICDEENQLFFVRQFKSDLSQLIRLPAYWNTENSGFSASSGDTIYAVNGEGLKVWQDGQLVQDPIINQSGDKLNIVISNH